MPRPLFDEWLARPGRRYQAFAAAVRQAEAQARLRVEVAVLESKPLDWLKSGPGKPRPGFPGWTAAARAAPTQQDASPLADPHYQELVALLIEATRDQPHLHQRLCGILSDTP